MGKHYYDAKFLKGLALYALQVALSIDRTEYRIHSSGLQGVPEFIKYMNEREPIQEILQTLLSIDGNDVLDCEVPEDLVEPKLIFPRFLYRLFGIRSYLLDKEVVFISEWLGNLRDICNGRKAPNREILEDLLWKAIRIGIVVRNRIREPLPKSNDTVEHYLQTDRFNFATIKDTVDEHWWKLGLGS